MAEITFDCKEIHTEPCGNRYIRVTATDLDENDAESIFAEIKGDINPAVLMKELDVETVKDYFGLVEAPE